MRKLLVGLGIAGLLLVGNSEVNAQKTSSSKELNERIKALRSRLQDYQTKTVRQSPARLLSGDETADLIVSQPELKGEKIVEELESRKDVAVTVLFHDSDSGSLPEPKVAASISAPVAASVAVNEKASADNHDLRSKRYEDLRQRVYLATRNARAQAGEINRQVASLP